LYRKLFGSILGLLAAVGFTAVIALAAPNTVLVGSASVAPSVGELQTAAITPTGQTMIAEALAKRFGVTISEVQGVRDQGFGWGEVVKVFAFAKASGKTPAAIIAMRDSGMGWGEIRQSLGLTPQATGKGGVSGKSKASDAARPGKANSNKDNSKATELKVANDNKADDVKDAGNDKNKDTNEAVDVTANVSCKGTNQAVQATGVDKCKGTNQEVSPTNDNKANGKQNPRANDKAGGKGRGK
jgi:hypothetical protein